MNLNEAELVLLLKALEKKIWSLDYVGMGDDNAIKISYKDVRTKVRAELKRQMEGGS